MVFLLYEPEITWSQREVEYEIQPRCALQNLTETNNEAELHHAIEKVGHTVIHPAALVHRYSASMGSAKFE